MANLESYRRYLEGSGNGLHFGVCLDQGQKKTMEDSHTASVALDGSFSSWSFFGVYDGHRGDTVSQYCAAHLLRCIMNTEEISQLYEEVLPAQEKDDLIRRGLVKGFLRVDEELRQLSEIQSGAVQGGSTATCALVTPEWIYLANCGDSRGMIVSQQGTVVLATRDHKPNTKTERQRIERAGLSVERGRVVGVVNSRIAMSRSLGDFRYKAASTLDALQQAVSPEPDIFRWSRTAQDEFIVLASDGVWDTLSNDGVCGVIRRGLQFTNDLQSICGRVLDHVADRCSLDNATVTIIAFPGSVRMSLERLRMEAGLDRTIELVVKGVLHWLEDEKIESDKLPDLRTLLCWTRDIIDKNRLSFLNEEFAIGSKRHIVERTWSSMRTERLSVRWGTSACRLSAAALCDPELEGPRPKCWTIDRNALSTHLSGCESHPGAEPPVTAIHPDW